MRLLIGIILLSWFSLAEAQQISVKTFRKLENDLSARTENRLDQNGDVCALIKVVVPEQGFYFDGDGNGIVTVERKIGEYWVFIPYGSRYLTVKHDKLGVLRAYAYPERIEKACVYELVLTTGRVHTVVEEAELQSGWLILQSEPSGADVYLDDKLQGTTPFQKKLLLGKYRYRLELPLYHSAAGVVELTEEGRQQLSVPLSPAFGYVTVRTEPETGAEIMVDGEESGLKTNATTARLSSGVHRITVKLDMYQPQVKEVEVKDGDTTVVAFTMQPNFAELSLSAPDSAELYIDGMFVGKGKYRGRLMEGLHDLEARQASHRSDKRQELISAGKSVEMILQPRPIYGKLDVITTPMDAEVWIDNRSYGKTPLTVTDLLIGNREVELRKQGYASVRRTVKIEENKLQTLQETLSSGRSVTLQTDREGDILYVDGKQIGVSPQKLELSYGVHTIRAERGEQHTEKELEVTETGGETVVTLGFGSLPQIHWSSSVTPKQKEILSRLVGNMVQVEGGRFQMGGTPEQGSDANDWEKPVHEVTLSDYYMGKYEVRQSEWEVVMGSNPSRFKGEDLPVEGVSWSDCHEFIERLNALTGLSFKLPTEAQWEYAARGGRLSKGYKYSGSNNLGEVGWYWKNSGDRVLTGKWDSNEVDRDHCRTHQVGEKQPNELSLYDMSGNVWEWCEDWYEYYSVTSQRDPLGAASGFYRVIRGGSWSDAVRFCRVSSRSSNVPVHCSFNLGFRLVC